MAKKVRTRAWQESEDSAINMANHLALQGRLGHQKPMFFMPWRVTGIIKNGADMPQDIILSIVFEIFC
jgi:hypothetical protein